MKPLFRVLVTGFLLASASDTRVHAQSPGPDRRCANEHLVTPTDPAFVDAQSFRRFLEQRDFQVICIIRSKFASFLRHAPQAGFLTNGGDIEVRFFPAPAGTEAVRIEEVRSSRGWRYTFPPHAGAGDTLYATRRQYFIASGRWLMLVADSAIASTLRRALPRPPG